MYYAFIIFNLFFLDLWQLINYDVNHKTKCYSQPSQINELIGFASKYYEKLFHRVGCTSDHYCLAFGPASPCGPEGPGGPGGP